jgi:hypothetical protein
MRAFMPVRLRALCNASRARPASENPQRLAQEISILATGVIVFFLFLGVAGGGREG